MPSSELFKAQNAIRDQSRLCLIQRSTGTDHICEAMAVMLSVFAAFEQDTAANASGRFGPRPAERHTSRATRHGGNQSRQVRKPFRQGLGHSNIKMTERYAKLGREHIAKTGGVVREMWKLLNELRQRTSRLMCV